MSLKSRGAALLMEMGTGKSLTAIAITGALSQAGRIRRVLVVAPLSILGVWEEEFQKFAAFPYALAVLSGSSAKKLDTAVLPDVQDSVITIRIYSRDASLFVSDIMLTEGTSLHKWTPAPNEIYTSEVKIDRRGIEVSNADSAQRTVINNTEFSGYYNDEKIFSLNKDETLTKKTVVDGELTVGKTKFVPMATASQGLNIVILD